MLKHARSFLLVTAFVVITIFIGDCNIIFEQQPEFRYGSFARTVNKYRETSDWEAAVRSELGTGWRVADWNDLETFYLNGGNLAALLDALGIVNYRDGFWLTKGGVRNFSAERFYFAERHNGVVPEGFLVHDYLGYYLLSLGSWYGLELPILAYKK